MLYQSILDHTLFSWLTALALFLFVVLCGKFLFRFGLKELQKLADNSDWRVHGFLLEVLKANNTLLVTALGMLIALQVLQPSDRTEEIAVNVMLILLIFQSGLWAHGGIEVGLKWRFAQADDARKAPNRITLGLLSLLSKLLLWVIVLLMVLDNLGLNITALVASLGIGGVAVALAVQNILSDLFASLSIAIDKPFVIGDFVIVGDLMGTVEHVGLKTTRLRSLDGEQIIFANNDLLQSRVRNFKRMSQRRCSFHFGVSYATTADQLEQIPAAVKAIIKTQLQVTFGRAHFKSFGESSLDFEVVHFTYTPLDWTPLSLHTPDLSSS